MSPKRTNPKGYKCACPEGKSFRDGEDNWCVSSSQENTLIVASSHTLYQLEHKKLGKQVITDINLRDIGEVGAITYDSVKGNRFIFHCYF